VATVTPTVHTNVYIELEHRYDMWVINIGPTVKLYELLSIKQKGLPKYIYL
jgi:hypothetical protein